MELNEIEGIPVYGEPQPDAVKQILKCRKEAFQCALMADHHLGYAVPIGGVIAYDGKISPSGVGYDIGCGNKAVLLDVPAAEVRRNIKKIMDSLWQSLSFGIGRKNLSPVEHPLFERPVWREIPLLGPLKKLAEEQLGTIGSGNHYVDLFTDELNRIWCGVHFGSRGLGHRTASHFIRAAGGKDGIFVDPAVIESGSDLGRQYIEAMQLAGEYAYAGRDWVCSAVAGLLGARILDQVHNHHNFAWLEQHGGRDLWVVRKGATPSFPGQRGFVGGSMGDVSVILEGVECEANRRTLYSTVHGAGRVMGRNEAAGKKRWQRIPGREKKELVTVKEGKISRAMMEEWVKRAGVELRGAGTDESPHCYKRLPAVLRAHGETIKILHTLTPIGVAMAGEAENDPYKD